MTYNRLRIIEEVCDFLNLSRNESDLRHTILLDGLPGTGKSCLLENIENRLLSGELVDCIIKFSGDKNNIFLTQFLLNSIEGINVKDKTTRFNFPETEYNHIRFNELLESLPNGSELTNRIKNKFKLLSNRQLSSIESFKHYLPPLETEEIGFIENNVDKSGDKRLILDNHRVAAESLIVDLINIFFPVVNTQEIDEDSINEIQPVKIVFTIDNYEAIAGSINRWIANFLFKYVFTYTFGDFISYNINTIDPNIRISQFFDFRFILAGQTGQFTEITNNQLINKNCLYHYHINPLTNDEIKYFLDCREIVTDSPVEEIQKVTKGLPVLLQVWSDAVLNGKINDIPWLISMKIKDVIGANLEDHEYNWLMAASFFDVFDETALKCLLKDNYNQALAFLKEIPGLVLDVKNDNITGMETDREIFSVNQIFRNLITESIKINDPPLYDRYSNVVNLYNNTFIYFSGLNNCEIEILRKFAYLNSFDREFTLTYYFGTDKQAATSFLTKRSELFDDSSDISNDGSSNNHASSDIAIHNDFSLKPEIKKALTPINQIIDKENFELTNTFVAEIYSKQEELLLEKKAEKEALRINTLKKVDALKKTLELKHIDQNSLKSVINDIENSLLELKEDSKYFETSDKRKKATKFILLAFISIVLGYGLPAIFGHFLSSTMISVFHYAFYGVATIFGFFGMSYILSILTIKANKQKLEWIRIKTRSHILRLEEIKKEIIKNNELIAAIEQDIVTNNAFADSLIDVANSMNVIQSENTQSKTN